MFSLPFSLSNLSEDQTGHVAHACRQRSGKRLQLLRDSRSRRQVIRQSGREQKLWAPAAGLSWMAAGHLSGLCSEELRQPATAPQQVRLQKVLWQKGPLSSLNDFFINKGFYKWFLMCSAHIEKQKKKKSYYWLYLWSEELPRFYC